MKPGKQNGNSACNRSRRRPETTRPVEAPALAGTVLEGILRGNLRQSEGRGGVLSKASKRVQRPFFPKRIPLQREQLPDAAARKRHHLSQLRVVKRTPFRGPLHFH